MARKQYCLKSITLGQDHARAGPRALFATGELVLQHWLGYTKAGRWCKKHLTDLTFRVNYSYTNGSPVLEIMARLEESDYTLYLLKYGGTDEHVQ